jgi:rRNA maturation RNase YbeY
VNLASLQIRNRQRKYRIDVKFLSRITRRLLREELQRDEFEIGISLVDEQAMVLANERYLRHQGSTDVITFHYAEPDPTALLQGDLLICVDVAAKQAGRFRATWPKEVVRYVVHGLLHLSGYDDQKPVQRRSMKKAENRLMKRLQRLFDLDRVAAQVSPHSFRAKRGALP